MAFWRTQQQLEHGEAYVAQSNKSSCLSSFVFLSHLSLVRYPLLFDKDSKHWKQQSPGFASPERFGTMSSSSSSSSSSSISSSSTILTDNDVDDLLAQFCQVSYHDSVRLYHWTVAASVLLALFCLTIRHVCLRDLISAPALAAQFYSVIATLQMVIAVVELVLFLPHCPAPCVAAAYCNNHYKAAYFVYPVLATALATLLYREAWFHHHKGQATTSARGDSEYDAAIMFQRIPEMEMQDHI